MGNKDREVTAQPLVNNNQSQVPNNSNKWVVNLSSTPLTQYQKSLPSQRTQLYSRPNSPSKIHHFHRVCMPEARSPRSRGN